MSLTLFLTTPSVSRHQAGGEKERALSNLHSINCIHLIYHVLQDVHAVVRL